MEKIFGSKRFGGAELHPLDINQFWKKKCIFPIVDLTEIGAANYGIEVPGCPPTESKLHC